MEGINFFDLEGKIKGFWALPTSGYGYICDEQPLPYIKHINEDLTPRFGGEFKQNNYDYSIVPLPFGILDEKWPLKQKYFNLFRRRVNIYWRNIFVTKCPKDKAFYFCNQLNYKNIKDGFLGESPLILYKRIFKFYKNKIFVNDSIKFKRDLKFKYFIVNPLIFFETFESKLVKIETSFDLNYFLPFSSSTGPAMWGGHKLDKCFFEKNQKLDFNYTYIFS